MSLKTVSCPPPEFVVAILREEAARFDTTVLDILEGCQMAHVVRARHAAVKRLSARPSNPSTVAIGRWLGMHHTSILSILGMRKRASHD